MGRELRRVPMDFDWPMNKVWPGYLIDICRTVKEDCDLCKQFCKLAGLNKKNDHCLDLTIHPPKGEGYQLWETTSEGSPVSPVFETMEELADWCENNATLFGTIKTTKEKWLRMFKEDFIRFECKTEFGTAMFI